MRKFFAAYNQYGSETSIGFANTWEVIAFTSKKARDEFVENSNDISFRKIKKKEIGYYVGGIKPYSGEGYRYGIRDGFMHVTPGYYSHVIIWTEGTLVF
jgi:hypothetical protein